jgi:Zn-dependent protease with chaperone function
MKTIIIAVGIVALAHPAQAQLGSVLGKAQKSLKKVEQAQERLAIDQAEEEQIGADVSAKIRERFGVVQDRAVHTYVTEVGLLLAHESSRPELPWRFIVLDTDGVNAFASPGGFIHVTRGALALMRNEAQLAGVLGHEITHVTEKHTLKAIQKNQAMQFAAEKAGGNKRAIISAITNKAYEMVIENSFDRGDEREADAKGIRLAARLGYAPAGLADFLARLADRNREQTERNGLFASHPETRERIDTIRATAGRLDGRALVAARYTGTIRWEPSDITEVPQATAGSAGLAGASSTKPAAETEKPPDPPKKKGFGLSALKKTVAPEGQSAQVSASGGARGVGPDRNAKGGPNPSPVTVSLTSAELAAFRKGIA